jgi:RNA polymerase sigma-70 factor, ECF subfamily
MEMSLEPESDVLSPACALQKFSGAGIEKHRSMDARTSRQPESGAHAVPRATGGEWPLVQRAIAGDANALELLVAPNLSRLYRVANSILRNKEDAEDALQEGLCKAYLRLGSFQGRSSFSTWLTRIVINTALMALRLQRRRGIHLEYSLNEIQHDQEAWPARSAVDHRPDPERICAVVELNALINEQILRLPAPERDVFLYYAINGHSVMESSQAFGIPAATLKSKILRTRRKLAHGLQHSLGLAYASSHEEKSVHAA